MKKIILSIDGMTCSACSNGLEKYLNKQEGIENTVVNLVMANATIKYDEKKLNQEQIEVFVKKAGFQSLGIFKEIRLEAKGKQEKRRLILFTVLALFLMYISMGHMIHLPSIPLLNPHTNATNYTLSLLLLAICFLIYGFDILKNGYKNLIHKTPNMDTLVSIGVISGLLYSLYNMYFIWVGNQELVMNLYFESSSIVIYFVKLGRYIDGISKDKTKEAIQKLVSITPDHATIRRDDREKVVTLDEIRRGDTVIARSGERIAVDGVIISGTAHFDEAFITGESKPVSRKKGDKVIAGSMNYDGYIEYQAERIGKESTISKIVELVVEASNTKVPIATLADKVSSYFVPGVILIAIFTFLFYLAIGEPLETSLTTFITILVVACPCSLGLATPLAIIVSEGVCASRGILIKKSEILENAKRVNTIVFDKTGILTYGELKISKILKFSDIEEKTLMRLVGSIEKKSTHPISRPFIDYLESHKIEPIEVQKFENKAGFGIIGTVDQKEILLGNSKMLDQFKINNPYQKEEKRLAKAGNSIVYVVENKKILAMIAVNDIVRKEAKQVVEELTGNNIEVVMLTGDNKETATKIAEELGITKINANALPEEKANIVKKLQNDGRFVMMCGDGINDSPALASARIGVSINSGAEIAMDSSDVILTRNNLLGILDLLHISEKTLRNIKQNLFWAFFYNCLVIPIAVGIFKPLGISINPMIASVAMVLSSLTVILNTLRLRKIKRA